jgi:hypothetical protein
MQQLWMSCAFLIEIYEGRAGGLNKWLKMVFTRILAFGAYFGLFVCSTFSRVTLPLSNMRLCPDLGGLS